MTDLDPKFTFDSFVVGPANRLACAAARRAAESPGASYNPLFVYSASGLGKSHILTAVAHQAIKVDPGRKVKYKSLESYLEELADALERGARDSLRDEYARLDLFLLDDVQFLTGQTEAQEMLLRTLDQLTSAGRQIVLASDRPPAEINGLDARLLSRFSGGLIVDIGPPEFETRVAIIRKKTKERGQHLVAGVAEALARYPFKNVRELAGALNRVLATQDLEERRVEPGEIPSLMGDERPSGEAQRTADEFGSFLEDLSETVAGQVAAQEEPWRQAIRESAEAAEREGFVATRLRNLLGGPEPADWEGILEAFKADVQRMREIDGELDRLGNPWPDAAAGVLSNPDYVQEAEALLASVRERQRPFARVGPGPTLADLTEYPRIAVKAAEQLVSADKPEYNPLYLWAARNEIAVKLLGAAARTYQVAHPEAQMAVTSVEEFAEDFIRALGEGVAGAWRERWWTVDLLLVYGLQALSETERAQDEFFHLFEAMKRRGARVLLVADRPPVRIGNIDERLRSRFEGGLVLELDADTSADHSVIELVEEVPVEEGVWGGAGEEMPAPVIPPLDELQIGDRGGLFIEGSPEAQEVASSAGVAESGSAAPRPVPPPGRAEAVPQEAAPQEVVAPGAAPAAGSPAAAAAGQRGAAPSGEESAAPPHGDEVAGVAVPEADAAAGTWRPSPENVVLQWPDLDDLLLEDLE